MSTTLSAPSLAGALLALSTSTVVHAETAPASPYALTANIGIASNYVFRGLTQTDSEPALQGGLDVVHATGFYAGTWLSNVSWFSDAVAGTTSSLEWDLYAGYRHTLATGIAFDVGALRYEYPGRYPNGITKPHTTEVYAAAGYKWATLKYSYSLGDTFGVAHARGTSYLDLTVAVPVGRFLISGHCGRQDYASRVNGAYTYDDIKVAAAYTLPQNFTVSLAWTDTNARDAGYLVKGRNLGDRATTLALLRNF